MTDADKTAEKLTASIRKAVDGTGLLESGAPNSSDATLEVTVHEAVRDVLAVESFGDQGRGRKFQLDISLTCTLYKGTSKEDAYFTDREIQIKQDIFADSGQVDAEFQAIPEITRKISERVVNLLTDSWSIRPVRPNQLNVKEFIHTNN